MCDSDAIFKLFPINVRGNSSMGQLGSPGGPMGGPGGHRAPFLYDFSMNVGFHWGAFGSNFSQVYGM